MGELSSMGKMLMIIGLTVFLIGGLIILASKLPFIGKLPGDFYFKRGNFTFYFPLATGILLSILLTIILNLILRR
ncbi:MAG: DUF2905 domain-containing protein [Bacillota bacterium]